MEPILLCILHIKRWMYNCVVMRYITVSVGHNNEYIITLNTEVFNVLSKDCLSLSGFGLLFNVTQYFSYMRAICKHSSPWFTSCTSICANLTQFHNTSHNVPMQESNSLLKYEYNRNIIRATRDWNPRS